MYVTHQQRKKAKWQRLGILFVSSILVIAFAWVTSWYLLNEPIKSTNFATSTYNEIDQTEIKPKPKKPEFNKAKYSQTDPASLWVVVNKKHSLPSSYIPAELVNFRGFFIDSRISKDLAAMFKAAQADGVVLVMVSGYRSYATQQQLFNNYIQRDGVTAAETYSARPGHSEHQTGLTVDIGGREASCQLEACYATTVSGKWLAANSYKFGFIVRYTKVNQATTGYIAEPWHLRYVGRYLSKHYHKKNIPSLEKFFNVSGGDYRS